MSGHDYLAPDAGPAGCVIAVRRARTAPGCCWRPAARARRKSYSSCRRGLRYARRRSTGPSRPRRSPGREISLTTGRAGRCSAGSSVLWTRHTPGHSDFHVFLHDERRRLLYADDHLLLEITPNIGLWTDTAPRPRERYLASIKDPRGPGVDLVFPGHGPLFHDLDGRIGEPVLDHEERLSVMRGTLVGGPATAFEVARRVFAEELSDHQLRFALAETIAHVERLVDEVCAERTGADVVRYRDA